MKKKKLGVLAVIAAAIGALIIFRKKAEASSNFDMSVTIKERGK